VLAASVAACASYDGRGLVLGQSTATQVETLMGPSADKRPGPQGETHLYYSRLPYGGEMYVARIGPDGKLRALEQRLSEQYFAKATPGVSRMEDMRALFGPPYRIQQFPRMEREIWEYPWRGPTSPRLLLLQYSRDGVLREIYSIEDPDGVGSDGDGL
jgi:hypothetical protein